MAKITYADKEQVEERISTGESLRAIAKSFGTTYQTLQYHRRRWGSPLLREARTKGENHKSWTGGQFVDRLGYTMIRVPERDCANPYTPEHVLVAEKMIGRQLQKGKEVVHHINGDKLDNRPDNLLVCTRSQHRVLHHQLEEIAYELLRRGVVEFRDGQYHLE